VLLVTNEYPPDHIRGTATATRFLAEELASRGITVRVVVNTREQAAAWERTGVLEVSRLRPVRVPGTRMGQRAMSLVRIARAFRPDVIQGQSLSCGCLALIAGRCLGIPAITYVQGLDLYQAQPWARQTYIRWTLTQSDGVVAVTDDLRARAFGLSGRLAAVIPHGLKLHDSHALSRSVARAGLGLPADPPIILFVGRLLALKGVDHLIRAMPRVTAACPEARLVIVGDGEERSHLMALVRDLELVERTVFAGERQHEDVIRYMRAADLFVLPSLIESFGIVLLEAMSCGLPVVASNVMGIPSLIGDGENGCLVPPGDEAALARSITRILSAPDDRAAFAVANVRKAMAYAWPAIADRFLTLWTDVVASRLGERISVAASPPREEAP